MSQRRWGRAVPEVPGRNQISEVKPVGALTERQRRMLAEQLECTVRSPKSRHGCTTRCAIDSEPNVTQLRAELPRVELTERYALVGAA